ncbi:MAG: hypothetical protein ABW068_13975 [Candidatus Thiodiazotropha sp.]
MKYLPGIALLSAILPFSAASAVSFEILDASPANDQPVSIRVATCPEYYLTQTYGTESDGHAINIYVKLFGGLNIEPSPAPCTDTTIEIGPFASGNYTLNLYTTENGGAFLAQDSKPIEIQSVSENEPPMGRLVFHGNPAEDQLISIDESFLSDANGIGDLSLQWYRDDEPIPGALYSAYFLTNEDVNREIRVVASYTDTQGNPEQFHSLPLAVPELIADVPDEPSGAVYITGSFSTGSTLTLHNRYFDDDGVTFDYLWRYIQWPESYADSRLQYDAEPYTITEQDLGLEIFNVITLNSDSLIWRDVIYSNRSSVITSARYAPVITLSEHLDITAMGALTQVDPGMVSAHDVQDGDIVPVLESVASNGNDPTTVSGDPLELPSGNHLLTWSATDGAGTTTRAAQLISIAPIIEFSRDHSDYYDDHYACPLELSGAAAAYPVTIDYRLKGIRYGDDREQTLFANTLRLDGHETILEIPIYDVMLSDPATLLSAWLEMDAVTNAVPGGITRCDIILATDNPSPRVSLTITQANEPYRILLRSSNPVVLNTSLKGLPDTTDPMQARYAWQGSDETLIDIDTREDTFTFDPASLQPGLYRLGVNVNLDLWQMSDELSFLVVNADPARYNGDTDQDGVLDYPDGSDDSDMDGIPDYLDHSYLPRNQLQVIKADAEMVIEADPGLELFLGDTAFQALVYSASIAPEDITNCGLPDLCGTTDPADPVYYPGLYNFQIKNLSGEGNSVRVVIPQQAAITVDSQFRVFTPSGWQAFAEDTNNQLSSVSGTNRSCPAPGSEAFVNGLNENSWCVQLTLEDGGPNDGDGKVDGKIMILGGIIVNPSDSSDEQNGDSDADSGDTGDTEDSNGDAESTDQDTSSDSGGGGGALSPG